MARAIKFKIWDKKQHLLLRTHTLNLKNITNDFILLQYTGMTDQQKTEIYEYDILIYQHRKYTVVWEPMRGGWSLKDNDTELLTPMDPHKASSSQRMYNFHEIKKD